MVKAQYDAVRRASEPQVRNDVLARVRLAALECRTAPRRSSRSAQGWVTGDTSDPISDLVQLLSVASCRRMIFWRPGTIRTSFDESWLVALIHAVRRDDRSSVTFLIRRRIDSRYLAELRSILIALVEESSASYVTVEPEEKDRAHG